MTETYSTIGIQSPSIHKDPDAILDYTFDWTEWLVGIGDSILSYEIKATGVTVQNTAQNGGMVTAWVSGGTAGSIDSITCRITTDGARVEDRTIYLIMAER